MSQFTFEGIAYPVEWCSTCAVETLFCSTCGNNTCNAGYGTVGGKDCPDCPKAYEAAHEMYRQRAA